MNAPQVTIIITQRERYSYTKPALDCLYQQPSIPFDLIYVDGNSPPDVHEYLQTQVARGMQLIRRDEYLTPNRGRNLALQQVQTKYVVFLDNDVLVAPYWLDHLVNCAEETGAWLVGPLYLEGVLEQEIVHMAGGTLQFKYRGDRKQLFESHHYCRRSLASVKEKLQRSETDEIEFHCVLARTEPIVTLNLLDEAFSQLSSHVDLSLLVQQAGGKIYFEPNAHTAYVIPDAISESDMPLFLMQWKDWSEPSISYFREKWGLSEDDPFLSSQAKWVSYHRLLASKLRLSNRLSVKRGGWLDWHILSLLESKLIKL